jgi:hypothetical protein
MSEGKSNAPALRFPGRRVIHTPFERIANETSGIEHVTAFIREIVSFVLVREYHLWYNPRYQQEELEMKDLSPLTVVGMGYSRRAWSHSQIVGLTCIGSGERWV